MSDRPCNFCDLRRRRAEAERGGDHAKDCRLATLITKLRRATGVADKETR